MRPAAFGFNTINPVNVPSGTAILDGVNSAATIRVSGDDLEVGDAASPNATLAGAVDVTGGILSDHATATGGVTRAASAPR